MAVEILGDRSFNPSDQTWFATVSGDCNPMHMDPIAARRTMAGFPVVHGIHALLWALDNLFRQLPHLPPVASIQVNFEKMIYVGDRVSAVLREHNEQRLRIEIVVEQTTAQAIDVTFGAATLASVPLTAGPEFRPVLPIELTFDDIEDRTGHVPLTLPTSSLSERFPAVSAVLGIGRVAGLAGTSFLVGMVCPGLHSIFRSLTLSLVEPTVEEIRFAVKYADPDYRFVRMTVAGAGWSGVIDTNVRPAPTAQAELPSLATRVAADEFTGVTALIIGGSRGLGELVAKILAAGGAHVIVTYSIGENDARRVQTEIFNAGGQCEIVHYDVREPAAAQIARLTHAPNQVYYMATPTIFQRPGKVFTASRLQVFLAFYVTGFADLLDALRATFGMDIPIFYPSSASLEDRPANMTEYTMAKAAGEILCADMRSFGKWRDILVRRLPRLPTDQTATLFEEDDLDSVEVILPIVREMRMIQ